MEIEDIYPSEIDLVEKRDQIVCPECSRNFSNRGALRMHLVKTHNQLKESSDISLQSRTSRVNQTKKRFHCPKAGCEKICENNRALTQHYQKSHSERNHKCEGCQSKFALERDLRYHIKKFCSKQAPSSTAPQKISKGRLKSTRQISTQTDGIVIKLIIGQRPDTISQQVQTEHASIETFQPNYYEDMPQTSDFSGQHGTSGGVQTYDQSTMYAYPHMVDVGTYATDSQNYLIEQNSYFTQTNQGYDCYLNEYTYQTNSSTQTSYYHR